MTLAGVLCKQNQIVIQPSSAGKTVVSGVTFQRTKLKADGVKQLESGMIKIGRAGRLLPRPHFFSNQIKVCP